MDHVEKWIWLPGDRYPDRQKNRLSGLAGGSPGEFAVAEFRREYDFGKKALSASVRFSGDNAVRLYCNGSFVASGPPAVGGDFIGNDKVRDNYYSYETEIYPCSDAVSFRADVRMSPVQICDYSKGRGGFCLSAVIKFDDGTETLVTTDESWLVRYDGGYIAPTGYDGRIKPDGFVMAEIVPNIWNTETAPIPVREERELLGELDPISLAHVPPGP